MEPRWQPSITHIKGIVQKWNQMTGDNHPLHLLKGIVVSEMVPRWQPSITHLKGIVQKWNQILVSTILYTSLKGGTKWIGWHSSSTPPWSGSVTRFVGIFFHETNPPRSTKNRQKKFGWKNHFRGDVREISDFAQAKTARSQKIKFAEIQNWLQCSARSFAGVNFVFAGLSLPY